MDQGFESLIRRADHADPEATDKLFAILYHELHGLAERNLRRVGASLTLGTTTLLHEAYLNIAARTSPRWRTKRENHDCMPAFTIASTKTPVSASGERSRLSHCRAMMNG